MKINKIKLFVNDNIKSRKIAKDVENLLIKNKFEIVDEDYDLALAIGGDGAFIRMVHSSNFNEESFYVGVNSGTLGFAQDINIEDIEKFIRDLKKENIYYEKIGIQEIEIKTKTEIKKYKSLNEIVIREEELNTFHANVLIEEELLDNYAGDGLLISTSFGSTAYNLSYGGSIVYNTFDTLQITPIAPLNNRSYRNLKNSIIVPSNKKIDIIPSIKSNNVIITIDGKNGFLNEVEKITTVINNKVIKIIRHKDYSFIKKVNDKIIK